jgi:tetratricopeptide (TPR) repeat protein
MKAARGMEAEAVFQGIGTEDADYPAAQTHLGFLLLRRSAVRQAGDAFQNALDREPGNSYARLGLGIYLTLSGKPGESAQQLEGILRDPAVGLNAQVHRAQALFYAGESGQALREARKMVSEHPFVAEFHRLLGSLYYFQGDSEDALHSYQRSVELEPDNLSAHLSLIAICRSRRDWQSALAWAQQALVLDRNQPLLYSELAEIYDTLGRIEEAEAARTEAERTFDAEILYMQATRSRLAGRGTEAENLLRQSTAKNPRLSKAWVDLGELLQKRNRFTGAEDAFRNALEYSPDDARAVLGVVSSLRAQGKEQEALRYAEKYGGERPQPDLLASVAGTLLEQGRAEEASAAMMEAIRQLPDNPDLLAYLGYIQQAGGRNQEALESFSAALRLNPAQVDALVGQAQSQLNQGQPREAIPSLLGAQRLSPGNTQIIKGLIQAYRQSGDNAAAESSCRACLQIDPADPVCREELAWLRMEAGDYRAAAEKYEKLVHEGFLSRSILTGLAFSLMRGGAYPQAIAYYEMLLKEYGPDAEVYTSLGYLHRCIGNISAAVTDYRRAHDLAPTDPRKSGDLGIALYLAKDFAAAAGPLQAALRVTPDWGMGHYHLAMVYWHLGQFRLALEHARKAQELDVREAAPIAQKLAVIIRR